MATEINFNVEQGQASNRGQSVLVTLSLADQANLSSIAEGDLATIDSSGNVGYVTDIDTLGGTFKIKPKYPYGNLSSSTSNSILLENETVIVTTN